MHRFFVPSEWIDRDKVVFSSSQARQLREVLRLKAGDRITVLDNSGLEYQVNIVDIKHNLAEGEVVECYPYTNEPEVEITLYQALLKGKKFDLVLQKCTEIGVIGFVPVICERCIASIPSKSRVTRWQRIIIEAAEQSGRGRVPILHPPADFKQACEAVRGFSLLPWETGESRGIKAAIRNIGHVKHVNIFIGPEGGFEPDEVEFARSRGILPVTLGKRILRSETAGMVTASAILYEYGELGD